MSAAATPRLVGSILIGVPALFAAAAVQRPEPAVIALPFLALALVALVGMGPPTVATTLVVSPDRVLQDEPVTLTATLTGDGPRGRVQGMLRVPSGLQLVDDAPQFEVVVGVAAVTVTRTLHVAHWGAIPPVRLELTATDRSGMFRRQTTAATTPLRAMPREATLWNLLSPRALRTIPGVHRSRQRGDGIEFADTRPMVAGDRARDVNWRISARHQELWVDDRNPERSGEVVLFLDTFVAVGDRYASTLRRSVEVAGALAARYTSANDRIGLVDLGGVMRWVKPGGGTAQLYRVVETLIDTELFATAANKTIDVLPVRALPRQAMVIALSPLIDPQGIDAIVTMRARGLDIAVIEVSPEAFVEPPPGRRGEIAGRLWQQTRARTRRDLRARGIAVATWHDGEPLDPVLVALGVFREAVLRAAR